MIYRLVGEIRRISENGQSSRPVCECLDISITREFVSRILALTFKLGPSCYFNCSS